MTVSQTEIHKPGTGNLQIEVQTPDSDHRLFKPLYWLYLKRINTVAMAQWAYYNNDFIPETDCGIPASDLAVQRGYGVFDFFKTVDENPVFLEDHLTRFYHSAAALRLPVGKTPAELKRILDELLERNALSLSGVRLTLTGGCSPDGFSITIPNLIITQQLLQLPEQHVIDKGVRLATYQHQRQLPHIKTIDYLMAVWLQPWLAEGGADDVLYYTNNQVSECPRANFFIVTNKDRLITPGANVLKGITRAHVLRLAGTMAAEGPVTLDDLTSAREAFITSTTKGILPVTVINNVPVGDGTPGPVTRQLAEALKYEVKGTSNQ
jgi:D-alanine transaminase/branched-chain amino acid aminotransferase